MFARHLDIPADFLQAASSHLFFLRRLSAEDISSYVGFYYRNINTPFFNTPDGYAKWGVVHRYTWAAEAMKQYDEEYTVGRGVMYGLFQARQHTPKLIGLFGLYHHAISYTDPRTKQAKMTCGWELSTLTDRHPLNPADLAERQRLGLTLAARATLLQEATRIGIRRVISRVEATNAASLAFARKSGFRHPFQTRLLIEEDEMPLVFHVARPSLLTQKIVRYIARKREEKCRL